MTSGQLSRSASFFKRLRRTHVLLIHPDDADGNKAYAHLKRIGCQVESVWPAPEALSRHVEAVFFLVDGAKSEQTFAWMSGEAAVARIGVIDYETPEILIELERFHVHGVISKPVREFGLLAALTTALSLARQEKRLHQRVKTLDETLKARRKIERAVSILSNARGISEQEAYGRIRDRAMKTNETVVSIAISIIEANEI